MKKSTRKKNALLVAAVISGLAFTQTVEAANIGIVTATDGKSNSQIGALQGSFINSDDISVVPGKITDLGKDAVVYNIIDQTTGESKIYLRQYNYGSGSPIPSRTFNAQGSWTSNVASGTIASATNAHGVACSNNYVYVTSYGEGTIGVGQISGNSITDKSSMTVYLQKDLEKYAGLSFGEKCQFHGEGIMIDGDTLYVIANVNPTGGYTPYDPSYLMSYKIKSNGSLEYNGYVTMGKNTDTVRINKYNNMLFVAAIGGYQNYGDNNTNAETSLDIAFVDTKTGKLKSSQKVKVPSNVGREMRDIKVMPDGTAYVVCYNVREGGNSIGLDVYKTTVANLVSSTPQNWEKIYEGADVIGSYSRVDAEYDTGRVWLQAGNELNIYTDGNIDPKVFSSSEFANSETYSNLYGWTMIKTDKVKGTAAKLRDKSQVSTNNSVLWKDNPHITDPVTANATYTDDTIISVSDTQKANLTNNILAGVYADKNKDLTINATGHTLNIQADNMAATPVGIYVGQDAKASVTADTINIITKGMEGGESLTNAIWVDPSANGSAANKSSLTVNGDVNIRVEGGMGGNGIAIAKTNRWGENSKASENGADITINGDVAIKGKTNQEWGIGRRDDNVISRFNNTGILSKVENGTITVNGNVDLDVYGNGIATVADGSKITVTGGGTITVPKGTSYGYYALASYGGDVSMNLGADGRTPGTEYVGIDGDIFVVKSDAPENTSVSLALTTRDSYLNGIIDNGSTANLYLQNGATWTNEANNTRYTQDNEDVGNGGMSRITNFYGGNSKGAAGVIKQTKNSKDLLIDNYSGHAMVLYAHDSITPTKILGGDTTITSAATNSTITLRTDSIGSLDNNKKVNDVLNALAEKLYYTNYKRGEQNLSGYVQIAEGLTSTSASLALGDISFDKTTGQGSLNTSGSGGTDPDPDQPTIPTTQDKDTFNAPILGDSTQDTEYVNHGVLKNDEYNFTKDKTTIMVSRTTIDGGSLGEIGSAVSASGSGKTTSIEMNGKELVVDEANVGASSALTAVKGGRLEVNNAGNMTINAEGRDATSALIAADGGEIYINNNSGVLKARANSQSPRHGAVIKTEGASSKITVTGQVDVVADFDAGSNEAVTADGGTINIAGGTIQAINGAESALRADNAGTININTARNNTTAGTNKVTLKGDVTTANNGTLNVGLSGTESYWEGDYLADDTATSGKLNLWIADGAHWIGTANGVANINLSGANSYWSGYTTNAGSSLALNNGAVWKNTFAADQTGTSRIGTFSGNAGYIDMTGDMANGKIVTGDLTIDNYSGSSTILYRHEIVDALYGALDQYANIIGGDVTIKSAANNSTITLRTDNNGIDYQKQELVDNTLNALAKKLYYTNYTNSENNLKGYVEIAEGLTTSSIAKKVGDIAFDSTSGQGSLKDYVEPTVGIPNSQSKDTFGTSLRGNEEHDQEYLYSGVLKDGKYNFTKEHTSINGKANDAEIPAGPWVSGTIPAAVSAYGENNRTDINLNGNDMTITGVYTGISAIDKGIVDIKNVGDMTVTSTGNGAALHTNGGGEIHIHNGDGGVLVLRSEGKEGGGGAVIKSKNGATGESKIIIDGMVDIIADGKNGVADAVNAVASTVEIGGGSIKTKNDTYKALWAYGEFVTDNAGIINVNVTKDAEGNIIGAGNRTTQIEGEISTAGNMGSKGQISVGLNTADSYWIGNYADSYGYGSSPGQWGFVNLWINNGAYWKGFSGGEMRLDLRGNGSYWEGFSSSADMKMTLADGAVWKNAISPDQKDAKGNAVYNTVGTFIGDGGYIDMTGQNIFTVDPLMLNAQTMLTSEAKITELGKGVSGNVLIKNYSGNTTVIYDHEMVDGNRGSLNRYAKIIGGTFMINSASEGSTITLRTSRDGIDSTNTELVSDTLNSLANKLYYTNYVTGERNLNGYVELEEGLTSAAVRRDLHDINFSEETGQGNLGVKYSNAIINTDKDFTTGLIAVDTDNAQATIMADGTGKTTTIDMNGNEMVITSTNDNHNANSILATNNGKVTIQGYSKISATADNDGTNVVDANNGGQISLKGNGILKVRSSENNATLIQASGTNSQITVEGTVDAVAEGSSDAIAADGGLVSIGGGTITAEDGSAIRAGGTASAQGRVDLNVVKDETGTITGAGTQTTNLTGNVTTFGNSEINIGLSGQDSSWEGNHSSADSNGNDRINLWLDNKAQWSGYSTSGVMNLHLANGAVWNNMFSAEQAGTSHIASLFGDGGIINMTGLKSDLTRQPAITTGDVKIDNYSGNSTVIYRKEKVTGASTSYDQYNIIGGTITIGSAAENSKITLFTDIDGISINNKDQVEDTLNSLANKLYYTGYTTAEDNLKGYVQIGEGLTSTSYKKALGDIEFDGTNGQGSLATGTLEGVLPSSQTQDNYTNAVTGGAEEIYLTTGVYQDDVYQFTKDSTTITVKNYSVNSFGNLEGEQGYNNGLKYGTAVVAREQNGETKIDLNGKNLKVEAEIEADTTGVNKTTSTALTAVNNGTLTIENAGVLDISAIGTGTKTTTTSFFGATKTSYSDPSAGIFAYGGKINITTADGGVVKVCTTDHGESKNGVGILATCLSDININGMVDVVADKTASGSNEAIKADASTITIGGGKITAQNGAATAITAVMSSDMSRYGVVNVNAVVDENNNMLDAGNRQTQIKGNLSTFGVYNQSYDRSYASNAKINVGLNGPDSYWEGNYSDTGGSKATEVGKSTINLFIKNGAHWKGFANGPVSVALSGAGSHWTGFSLSDKMLLSLKDGATWYNAGNKTDSKIGTFIGSGGYIDMTGATVFKASSTGVTSAYKDVPTLTDEATNGVVGNVTFDSYEGDTTVIYRNQADNESAPTQYNIIGGNITITSAKENSQITLYTERGAMNLTNSDLVNKTLDSLANKLYYKKFTGGEANLKGWVEIGESLTQSAVKKQIAFSASDGKGNVQFDYTTPILGDRTQDTEYVNDGIVTSDGTYDFTLGKVNIITNGVEAGITANGDGKTTTVNMNDKELTINATNTGASVSGISATNNATVEVNDSGNLQINAQGTSATGLKATNGGTIHIGNNDGGIVKLRGEGDMVSLIHASGNASKIIVDGTVDILAEGGESAANGIVADGATIEIDGGTIVATGNATAIRSVENGTVNINVTKGADGQITGAGTTQTNLEGTILTTEGGKVNLGLNGESSYWKGHIDSSVAVGSVNLWLNDKATWYNTSDQTANKINNLTANNGYIDMTGITANGTITTGDVVVDQYSGNSTLIYRQEVIIAPKGDLAKYANIIGGNFTINSATAGSKITLYADIDGIALRDTAMVEDALNSLANKLYYTGYTNGENNLQGYVQLAEGLTSTSYKKAIGDIVYSATDGQGSLKEDSVVGLIPNEQAQDTYYKPIWGKEEKDIDYITSGVRYDDSYNFTKPNTNVIITGSNDYSSLISGSYRFGILGDVRNAETEVNLNSNNLVINVTNSTAGVKGAGILAGNNGTITINTPGDISVTAQGNGGDTYAMFATGYGKIHIANGNGGVVKLRTDAGSDATKGEVLKAYQGTITIDGMVDIVADKNDGASVAVEAYAATVDIGGGNIEAKNGATALWAQSTKGTINVNTAKDEVGDVNGAGNRKTTIVGDIMIHDQWNSTRDNSVKINVGLNDANSYWKGNYVGNATDKGTLNLWVANGAYWKGIATNMATFNLDLSGNGSYWHGFTTNDKLSLNLKNGAVWYNALSADQTDGAGSRVDSRVTNFVGNGGFIDMTGKSVFNVDGSALSGTTNLTTINETINGTVGNLVIDNYSGNSTVIYRHEVASDDAQTYDTNGVTNQEVNIIGGNTTINSAAAGSSITLVTDRDGIDLSNADLVADTLNALANKLYYTNYVTNERNLEGYAKIADGLTTASITRKLGNITFSEDDGQGSIDRDSIQTVNNDNTNNPSDGDSSGGDSSGGGSNGGSDSNGGNDSNGGVIYGDSETAMMRGTKSAMAASAMIWRAENDDMMKRLGEIRNEDGEVGVWAKYYSGKVEMNAQKAKFTTDYSAYQFGVDKQVGQWLLGTAFSYNDAESSYQMGGNGDNSVASLSFYGTRKASNGTYLDLVAKVSRLDSDFTIYNDMQMHRLDGNYSTWGASVSAEYGKRFEQTNGFYFDPSAQLTIGRVQGKDYTAASDFRDANGGYKNMYIHQDSMNSIVGKIGLGFGQKADRANYFAKLALAHEFAGDFDTRFRADGEDGGRTNIDFGGTWCELEIGGGVQLNEMTMLYATYERNFGGDVREKYRIDGGIRVSF